MAAEPLNLVNSGTSPQLTARTRKGKAWVHLVYRFRQVGMAESFEALSACGLGIRGVWGPQASWGFSPCGTWYCPPCAGRRQQRYTRKWVALISEAAGEKGGCGTMVLTLPHSGTAVLLMARLRQSLKKLRGRSGWRKPSDGWAGKVGVLAAFEVSHGNGGEVHPHLHVLVFGPQLGEVEACQWWILETWEDLNSGATVQDLSLPVSQETIWRRMVAYMVKGTVLDPTWSSATLSTVMECFPPRAKHLVSFGRLARRMAVRRHRVPVKSTLQVRSDVKSCA